VIPILVKVGLIAGAGYLALRRKPAPGSGGAGNPPADLPQAPQGPGCKDPVIGQRWNLCNVDLVSIVSETNDRFEGYYHSKTGHLVAVVDANTFDPSRTSAVVVRRDLAPDLPEVWT
jgi:hypothetical protein